MLQGERNRHVNERLGVRVDALFAHELPERAGEYRRNLELSEPCPGMARPLQSR